MIAWSYYREDCEARRWAWRSHLFGAGLIAGVFLAWVLA